MRASAPSHRCRALLLSLSGVAVRDMLPADVPAAARLLNGAFAPAAGYNWLQDRVSYEETKRGLVDRLGATMLLVAEASSGHLVGTVEAFTPAYLAGKEIRFWDAALPLETYVSSLAIDQAVRRRGVAALLMRSVEERTLEAGAATVSLQVDASNDAALELYRKLGYRVVHAGTAVTTPSRDALVTRVVFGGARSRSLLAFQKALLQTVSTSSEAEAAGERVEYRLLRTLVTWLRAAVRRWRAAIWELIARVVGRRKE